MLMSWMLNFGCMGRGAGVLTKAGDGAGTEGGGGAAGGGTAIGPVGGSPGTLGGIWGMPGSEEGIGITGRGLLGGTPPVVATSEGSSSVAGLTGDS